MLDDYLNQFKVLCVFSHVGLIRVWIRVCMIMHDLGEFFS